LFPRVFEAISKKPNDYEYRPYDIFGKAYEKELDNVCLWLQQIPTFRAGLVPGSTRLMSREAILAVEAASSAQQAKEDAVSKVCIFFFCFLKQ